MHCVVEAVAHEAGHAILDDLDNRAAPECDHGRATCQCLDHHEAERFRPVDGKHQCAGAAEERLLLGLGDLADELDVGLREQRLDVMRVIGAILWVELRGDSQA